MGQGCARWQRETRPIFALSKIAFLLLRPSAVLVLLVTAGTLLAFTRRRRSARVCLVAGALPLLLLTAFPLDAFLLRPLEDRFPQPDPPTHVDGIIVLGGGIDEFVSADRGRPTLTTAGERMTELAVLARRYPDARVVYTGGSGALDAADLTEAAPAGALAAALGVDPSRLTLENRSRNTWENAVFSQRLAAPKPEETWLLVTSASHMPRSVGIFRRVGWAVVPWPVGYRAMHADLRWLTGLPDRLVNVDWAAHEFVGLVSYRLMGRTSALFPEPDSRADQAVMSQSAKARTSRRRRALAVVSTK